MAYEDKVIVCEDCGAEFVHSAGDQARYAERGFTNNPKRCRECRAKRKVRQGGSGATGEGGGRGRGGAPRRDRGGGGRGPRESFEAVCASCGVQTTVPFKPVEGRPVYCRECYRAQS